MKKIQWIIIGILMMLAIVILNTQVMAADSNGNMVIVLDPGHGGGDPGASNSTYGLQEAKVNYQIAINSGSTSSRGAEIWVTQDKPKNVYYQRS